MILIMAVLLVGMAWYSNSSKRNQIYCSFTRINKTEINKFVKMKSRYVVFDGKMYDVMPTCIKFIWWDKGIVGMLFPQYVAKLDFVHWDRFPIDPATAKPAIISPEVRAIMNKEEWTKSFAKSMTPPNKTKQSMLQQYLPWISVILVVIVAVYLYMNISAIGQHLQVIDNQLRTIPK